MSCRQYPADAQLMSIAATSTDLPIDKVDDYIETTSQKWAASREDGNVFTEHSS
ncbi:hypothetical protein NKH52_28535 [Mesorhizobium sp. M1066]|uniref:hypothetical protein n=1 Tax=unclassified Mesorhizobium TaxID=325217 RepID=UPI003336CC69